jgi:RNA polymerase sigma factor (TIGR02999 family)
LLSEIPVETVTRLVALFRGGNKEAANELMEIFYPELRRLAAARLRHEPEGHSWQPTLLVNELYLELIKINALPPPETELGVNGKVAFFGLAAHLMKRLLIHHARPLAAKQVRVELPDLASDSSIDTVTDIETALSRLQAIRPRLRSIVELKVFEGMTAEEIAARLGCSTATAAREWKFAQRWLQDELAAWVEN